MKSTEALFDQFDMNQATVSDVESRPNKSHLKWADDQSMSTYFRLYNALYIDLPSHLKTRLVWFIGHSNGRKSAETGSLKLQNLV